METNERLSLSCSRGSRCCSSSTATYFRTGRLRKPLTALCCRRWHPVTQSLRRAMRIRVAYFHFQFIIFDVFTRKGGFIQRFLLLFVSCAVPRGTHNLVKLTG